MWAAVAEDLEGQGGYHYVDCNINDTHPKGHDMNEAQRLASLSEELLDHILGPTREVAQLF